MKKWTNESIENGIMDIARQFETMRMPTDREVVESVGNASLAIAIQKSGGYVYWANKLNLPRKKNATMTGIDSERKVAEILKAHRYQVTLTPTRYPYDILVNDCVKIDVKCAHKSYIRGCEVHAYRISKPLPTCDIYVCRDLDDDKYYIIPAHKCVGMKMIEMGAKTKYDIYQDKWELIGDMCNMFRQIK
jgi:hypothetical protein